MAMPLSIQQATCGTVAYRAEVVHLFFLLVNALNFFKSLILDP